MQTLSVRIELTRRKQRDKAETTNWTLTYLKGLKLELQEENGWCSASQVAVLFEH